MHITDYILIVIGLIFNFFIPGFVFTEAFASKSRLIYKLPLYLLLSVLLSTNIIYLASLIFGLNSLTIFSTYVFWTALVFLLLNFKKFPHFAKNIKVPLLLAFGVFIIFFVSLFPAIFYKYHDYFVLSADNWQDTALHLSISQSLTQGNFPAQAPYFSGHPLSYYYFTDLHTAIVLIPVKYFLPRFFILDNSIFAAIYVLSVYSLSYALFKNTRIAVFTSILSIFSGSFLYLKFLRDFIYGLGSIKDLILSGAYVLEYGRLIQMTPVTNYFLQNRPMMVGMPALVLGILLLIKKKPLYSLFIALLVLRFQIFITLIIGVCIFFYLLITRRYKLVLPVLFLIFPALYFLRDYLNSFLLTFSLGPWTIDKDWFWFAKFFLANFGILFIGTLIFFALLCFRKIKFNDEIKIIIFLLIFLVAVPLSMTFTIDRADMLKFFYPAFIPMSIFTAVIINKIFSAKFGPIFAILIIISASGTGFIDLAGSFLSRNFAYSIQDYKTGIWIRNNTPQKTVFVTLPTVHSSTTDIGGRLRILSYTNWPYTHGFNSGSDNVFTREEDIKKLYETGDSVDIKQKYNASYIYYGSDEKSAYPNSGAIFDSMNNLEKIYNQEGIAIYEIL